MIALAVAFCGWLPAMAASTDFDPAPGSPKHLDRSPGKVALADLDGDGDLDLAVAEPLGDVIGDNDHVAIFMNNGAGRFAARSTSPESTGDNPSDIEPADIDGDGDLDLVIPNYSSGDLTILVNNGLGNFSPRSTSPETGYDTAVAVAAVDVDGDGDLDLAVAQDTAKRVAILVNNGLGNFRPRFTSPELAIADPHDIVAADWDEDGDMDLAVASVNAHWVSVLYNTGVGNYVYRDFITVRQTGNAPDALAVLDANKDGHPDLAVANRTDNTVSVMLNNGHGLLTQRTTGPEAVGLRPNDLTAADFDGDGDTDLAVVNGNSGDATILVNNGFGNYSAAPTSPEGIGRGPVGVASGDIDGDGDPDLVASAFNDFDVVVLRNLG
ncbi:FG-GAP repeat domain-containing protein [Nocardioides sp. MH1]|uniref:FG-GAP repeat domain-containing protein n=1 Tax=Nocardioides sp. MH1 TaxID=3242490 RepID=UPI003520A6F2